MVDVLRVADDALLLRADPAGAAAINAVPVEKGVTVTGLRRLSLWTPLTGQRPNGRSWDGQVSAALR
jgi:hypothetical protein